MYACPSCGGGLKFNISTQQLSCDYCSYSVDPHEYTKEADAEGGNEFDATVFTCPQCGGEILSDDNSVAAFCSYCGASTILHSRLTRAKRPDFIIPFAKTKEDCKIAYKRHMRTAIFAPKELKDSKLIDSFRGIYMPYWLYTITQTGPGCVSGTKEYRRGDYIITDHYNVDFNSNTYYKGIAFDASSSFADNISEDVAPYDVSSLKPFTPAYLCGFYGDTSDVASSTYRTDAYDIANAYTYNQLARDKSTFGLSLNKPSAQNMSSTFNTQCSQVNSAMFPVWFLSYRKDNRVIYATVNGQTGKVVSDLPVDIKKYFLTSFFMSIVIFVLLNMFLVVRPTTTLLFTMALSLISGILYALEIKKINAVENFSDDKGYISTAKQSSKALFVTSVKKNMIPFFSILGIIIAVLVFIGNPVSDVPYYLGSIVAFVCIGVTLTQLILKYNILATRKLKQFDKQGGDNNA